MQSPSKRTHRWVAGGERALGAQQGLSVHGCMHKGAQPQGLVYAQEE